MSESGKVIYHLEFNTPDADKNQTLNFYEVPPAIKQRINANFVPKLKNLQERNKIYINFNNLNKMRILGQTEQILPPNRFCCLLWTRKGGQKFGILFDKSEEGGLKALGIWNLIMIQNIEESIQKIDEDLENLEKSERFEDVTFLF